MTFEQIEKLLAYHSAAAVAGAILSGAVCFARWIWLGAINSHGYDSLIVAAAIQGDCEILYSEDLQSWRRLRRSRCSTLFSSWIRRRSSSSFAIPAAHRMC